jgi:hypothetical protein
MPNSEVYGILCNKTDINIVNHLRAILDLMLEDKNLGYLKGFRNDFLTNDKYIPEFFNEVYKFRNTRRWHNIHLLMLEEYRTIWLDYKKFKGEKGIQW